MALAFARAGARLAITDVNAQALEAARAQVAALGAGCVALRCDVSDPEEVMALAEQVQAQAGVPDILVNNAGIGYLGRFLDTPLTAWRRVLDINVMGVVHGIRAFLPAMQGAPGERWVVNVASAAGFAPPPTMAAYAASKHAVIGLSEVLAMELDGSNVQVMMVCPGVINTPIISGARSGTNIAPQVPDEQIQRLQAYYVAKGCAPRVVAEGLLAGLQRGTPVLFVGPFARMSQAVMRVSRRLARRINLRGARAMGYL
jgi:NAD(P)-dependent dehydrogenase (short-subunit alcohol dehydrogenase family)